MGNKRLLFLGISLLTIGLLLRIFTDWIHIALPLIVSGVFCKILYLRKRVLQGNYQPGIEMLCLAIGLALFFSGLFLKTQDNGINPYYLIAPGIALKVCFILLFIKKMNKK